MRIDTFIISLLIFGIFVFVGFTLMGAHIQNYGVTDESTDSFAGTYSNVEQLFEEQKDIENSMIGDDVDDDAVEDSMFKGAFNSIRGLWSSMTIAGNTSMTIVKNVNVGDDTSTDLLTQIVRVVMVIAGIGFLFGIIFMVLRIGK